MIYVVRTLRESFTPLRLPNLRTYLIGQAISLLGTWMQVTAQGWLRPETSAPLAEADNMSIELA